MFILLFGKAFLCFALCLHSFTGEFLGKIPFEVVFLASALRDMSKNCFPFRKYLTPFKNYFNQFEGFQKTHESAPQHER